MIFPLEILIWIFIIGGGLVHFQMEVLPGKLIDWIGLDLHRNFRFESGFLRRWDLIVYDLENFCSVVGPQHEFRFTSEENRLNLKTGHGVGRQIGIPVQTISTEETSDGNVYHLKSVRFAAFFSKRLKSNGWCVINKKEKKCKIQNSKTKQTTNQERDIQHKNRKKNRKILCVSWIYCVLIQNKF